MGYDLLSDNLISHHLVKSTPQKWLTFLSRISSGVDGGTALISAGRSAALRQFLIRGASCAFPSVFCREGTGWYVLRAVFISGKTVFIPISLKDMYYWNDAQAIVVLIRPTLVNREILANSIANWGVSIIFSFRTFEHLVELNKALT